MDDAEDLISDKLHLAMYTDDHDMLYAMRNDEDKYVRLVVIVRLTDQDVIWGMRNDESDICRLAVGMKLTSPGRILEVMTTLDEYRREVLAARIADLAEDII